MINSPLLMDMMLFVAVVENKSFSAAARQFGVTKSIVSKRITRLEKRLGIQLIFRSTRKLSLSEAGNELFERCLRIKADLEDAELALTVSRNKPHGTLRINCPVSFGYLHLVPAISDFNKIYPEVHVELFLGMLYDDLIESGLDMAIRIGELPDSNLSARKLTVRRMLVSASPEYLKKYGTPKEPEDLLKHNCLRHLHSPTGTEWRFVRDNHIVRIPIQGNFAATSSQTIESAAVAGMGIAMLPGYMTTSDIKKGNLVRLLVDYCPRNIGIHAVYPQTAHLAPKVRAFIDFCAERFGDESYWR